RREASQPGSSPTPAAEHPARNVGERETSPRRLATTHLPNAVQVHSRVISGGSPHGEEGYRELAELGVKTVISVDGATPDIETANRYGLRYVHLPHGYDGIPRERVEQLAKAVKELEGPIYIHCHHGKHRSPAAASVACIGAGLIDQQCAQQVLSVVGTGKNYRRLLAEGVKPQAIAAPTLVEAAAGCPGKDRPDAHAGA